MTGEVIVTTDRAFDFTQTMKLTVGEGEDQKSFIVHPGTIRRADFFRARLKKEWKQGDDHEIKLIEDNPATVELYLHLLYGGSIPVRAPGVKVGQDYNDEVKSLASVYVFAEKVGDVVARNIALEAIIDISNIPNPTTTKYPLPGVDTLNTIYNGTVEGNRARQLVIDLFAHRAKPDQLNSSRELPFDFLVELSRHLLNKSAQWKNSLPNPYQQKHVYREVQ
ncbi:hypothetical protein BDV96DRAFT_640065 [Lophiotrema nucula]|uniref:BTB domain-containing protein n=1 Tax=Lophiotrema nucula TaxID=690887 RepID=A0A6A5ZRX5_9PLEO|nr:hypothetical protein BDV96DRAFT_640065 [Lophiotrema nucula]